MARHELLPAQTATPPSRPAEDLAPVDGGIVIAFLLGRICHRECRFIGSFGAPPNPGAASQPPHSGSP